MQMNLMPLNYITWKSKTNLWPRASAGGKTSKVFQNTKFYCNMVAVSYFLLKKIINDKE